MSKRTPYDTGKRSEPKVWPLAEPGTDEDYGKVDFEDDAGGTLATLYIEQSDDRSQYTLKGWTNESLKVDIDSDEDATVTLVEEIDDQSIDGQPLSIQPSPELQAKVQLTIDDLYSPYEREEATVYWQEGQALILVPGEKHVRKQQAIIVHEPGYPYADTDSAIVKNWESGVQRTRID